MVAESVRQYDRNGWFEIKNQPLSRVGVFPYLGKNIPGAPDPDKLYNVYRPADALSNPEFIESLKLTPWVDDHTMLGSEDSGRMPAEQKGIGGVIGEQLYFENDTLYGNVKVLSEAQKTIIDSGKKELSLGYYSQYQWQSGVYAGQPYEVIQIPRYGNHLASVDDGRMGPEVAVLDHFTITIDSKEFQKMAIKNLAITLPAVMRKDIKLRDILVTVPTTDSKEKPRVLKLSVPTFDADESTAEVAGEGEAKSSEMSLEDALAAFGALMPIFEKFGLAVAAPTPVASSGDDDAAAPANIAAPTKDEEADDKKKDAPTMDAAAIGRDVRRDIAAAARLGAQLSKVVGTFDYSEMSELEVAQYGVKKLDITCAKGSELASLSGYLTAVEKQPAAVVATTDKGDYTGVPFYQAQIDARK